MESRADAVRQSTAYDIPSGEEFSWHDAYKATKEAVQQHQPVILYGPPGTGKTRLIYELKNELEKSGALGAFEVIQFHRKFSYEDFIEGFSPTGDGTFEKRDGVFKTFAKNASSAEIDLFVIDEINRAEITTTFGELMFLIEDREQRSVKTSHFSDEMSVPANLSLIGTMNTADRNIATLDYALRRRFTFIPVFPDYAVLKSWLNRRGFAFHEFGVIEFVRAVTIINSRITHNRLMGRNMQLGHAMWVPKGNDPITKTDLVHLFQFEIIPQLEAYLGFGNEGQLSEMLNTNVASHYLHQKKLTFEILTGLVNDLTNEQS